MNERESITHIGGRIRKQCPEVRQCAAVSKRTDAPGDEGSAGAQGLREKEDAWRARDGERGDRDGAEVMHRWGRGPAPADPRTAVRPALCGWRGLPPAGVREK